MNQLINKIEINFHFTQIIYLCKVKMNHKFPELANKTFCQILEDINCNLYYIIELQHVFEFLDFMKCLTIVELQIENTDFKCEQNPINNPCYQCVHH